MKNTLFEGNLKLTKLDLSTEIWYLEFEGIIFLQTSCFWRFFIKDKIEHIANDNDQVYRFGEPKIDSVKILSDIISNSLLLKIEHELDTGDLMLNFENDIKLVFYTSSMVFENWDLSIDKKKYISLPGGKELATWN
jgi:hypothetical protein